MCTKNIDGKMACGEALPKLPSASEKQMAPSKQASVHIASCLTQKKRDEVAKFKGPGHKIIFGCFGQPMAASAMQFHWLFRPS